MKRAALALIAALALAGCGGDDDAATTSSTTTEPDSTKVTVDGLALDQDNYTDRFGLSHKQWLDELISVRLDDDSQQFEVATVLDRPADHETAVEMCEALIDMATSDGIDSPKVEVLGNNDVLMARGGYNSAREGCNRV